MDRMNKWSALENAFFSLRTHAFIAKYFAGLSSLLLFGEKTL
jgi:hypothetical protein